MLFRSTSGTVTVDGHEILEEPLEAKRKLGYLPEMPPLYVDMTVEEYLSFAFDLKKVKLPKREHIEEVCGLVRIGDVRGRVIRHLSKGYRQRVGLAQALLGNPDVLILDEPTVGLDPKQIIEIRALIRELGERHTVILSSHILPEVQAVCDRVIVINKGRLVADGTPEELSHALSTDHKLTVRVEGPEAEILKALGRLKHIERAASLGEREPGCYDFNVEASSGYDIRRGVSGTIFEHGWALLGMRSSELSLEDIFLQLTEDSAEGDEA